MNRYFTNEEKNGIDIIRFSFENINNHEREEVKICLRKLIEQGQKRFVVDISGIAYVSSLVIALILSLSKEITKNKGQLKISGLSNECFSIFQITKLDKILDLYKTELEAMNSFV